ncbi:hypothetical protein [Arthrobacter cryoconiti]|uniref:Uncharacterized protein n=1 Tax=Arthrobacter cryoconiti TaxID=748907 RepID=A0ABV8QZS5_9MICC|nr:hypothetical protein [Arthrobacter cryoconiti]MCC9068827.1 hypothetical protein [Arthrobacter cryoconiti]
MHVKYTALVAHLKQHPGTWAKVRTTDTEAGAWAAAHQIKNGRRAAFRPPKEFESYTDGCVVMARYIGHTPALASPVATNYCTSCGAHNPGPEVP